MMNNLVNLDNIPEEKRKKILEILGQREGLKSDLDRIAKNTDYDPSEKNTAIDQPILKPISVDNAQAFESGLAVLTDKHNASDLYERRTNGKLTTEERETYRQLNIIHKDGFWNAVRDVVSRKRDISVSEVSDKVSMEDLGL